MKTIHTIIVLLTLTFSMTSISQIADSMNMGNTFIGLILIKNKKTIFIQVGDKISIKTSTNKYKGNLDSVAVGKIQMDNNTILTDDIVSIKYSSLQRKKNGKVFLLSAPISFVTALGFGYWYLGSGGEWTNLTAIGILTYTPVAIITGLVLLKRKQFKLKNGWILTIRN